MQLSINYNAYSLTNRQVLTVSIQYFTETVRQLWQNLYPSSLGSHLKLVMFLSIGRQPTLYQFARKVQKQIPPIIDQYR